MCLVQIPNPRGGNEDYQVLARTSREAAQKAMEAHPYSVDFDAVITVIADGLGSKCADAAEHNAKQPTFWLRAGTVGTAHNLIRSASVSDVPQGKRFVN